MGSGASSLTSCYKLNNRTSDPPDPQDVTSPESELLDETLGHSFCYVRSSARFTSPNLSGRLLSPPNSLRFSLTHEPAPRTRPDLPETVFKSISGASVSANSSTPRTVLRLDNIYDVAADTVSDEAVGGGTRGSIVNGFESTSSFCAIPLQPVPRGGDISGPLERGGFFLSGPIERGFHSGPLEVNAGVEGGRSVPFSAPLGGTDVKKRRDRGISGIRKAFYRNISEKKRSWVVPVLNFVGLKGYPMDGDESELKCGINVQWALGKAGEDRVHVVVSEEHGWLFVGIYDGFNGPDAPEFLMGNLYRAVYNELRCLFWDVGEAYETNPQTNSSTGNEDVKSGRDASMSAKKATFQAEGAGEARSERRRLWEYLAEDDPEDGLDLSGSNRFVFSVDDALRASNAGAGNNRRWLLLKLKNGLSKHKESRGKKLFPWKFGMVDKEKVEEDNQEERRSCQGVRGQRVADPQMVLGALSRALEVTEGTYLDMTDKVLYTNPELALMGSCVLVVLMRDEDVYVMNVGDSRAIVAQYEPKEDCYGLELSGIKNTGSSMEGMVEASLTPSDKAKMGKEDFTQEMRLTALQLSTDHSTNIEEEVLRIKSEHPDDSKCIVNDRVKGRLKVTRAFGAGFLKQPKWNDTLLEVFRNHYIGTAPYVSCSPSLCHHRLCPRDQFIVLSSDGLYQYLSNQEVVTHVASFLENFPEGDPAQHLIEELLLRAAKKAGMDFHELLDIPQGDRRKYHDDVTVMVISLEGRIWKSSGKCL